MKYIIYHPMNETINHECKRGLYEYHPVAHITTPTIEAAFYLAQHGNGGKLNNYPSFGVRSTCVGDIIAESPIYNKGNAAPKKFYMVTNHGFTEVPFTVVTYIDWGNH